MNRNPRGPVRTAAALCLLSWGLVPALSQTRLPPQPATIWGATNVTVYRNSPKYVSNSGNHYLVYQADGNLVIRSKSEQFVWGLNAVTNQFASTQRITFANGNIIAYDQAGKVVWQAITPPNTIDPGARPFLTETGVLRMFYCRSSSSGRETATSGGVFWASDNKIGFDKTSGKSCGPILAETAAGGPAVQPPTNLTPTNPTPTNPPTTNPPTGLKPARAFPFPTGTAVERGVKYTSPSGRHYLIFAPDGNLIVRGAKGDGFLWGLNNLTKNYDKSAKVEFRPDGSLVAADAQGRPVWSAPQAKLDPNSQLVLSFDGALQVVASTGDVLWSSDGNLAPVFKVFITKANVTGCKPEPGWAKCIQMASPSIQIMGTARATANAMNGVANVYAEMTTRFQPKYPASKFDGFKVYLTNGEPWSALANLKPVGPMWTETSGTKSGNFLRGGASLDFLWISEQMICKDGVATRNLDHKNGLGTPEDRGPRAVDQVVHEFTHSIAMRYGLENQVNSVFARDPSSAVEAFPQNAQQWFGAGGGKDTPGAMGFMKGVFTTQTKFSCEGYRP